MEINSYTKDYIKIYDNVIPEKILDNLIKICKASPAFKKAGVVGVSDQLTNVVDEKIRKVFHWCVSSFESKSLTEVHWNNYLSSIFCKFVVNYLIDIKLEASFKIKEVQILKYIPGGHYTFHVDHGTTTPRTYSCIFYLNEDYKGGQLVFRDPINNSLYKIDPKKNRMIVWPSNFMYPHSVTPVTEGERYSVVSWAL